MNKHTLTNYTVNQYTSSDGSTQQHISYQLIAVPPEPKSYETQIWIGIFCGIFVTCLIKWLRN